MAQENEIKPAEAGTNTNGEANQTENAPSGTDSPCPNWDKLGTAGMNQPPFFNPNEALKRAGFRVMFLDGTPRKETPNRFKQGAIDYWFNVMHEGEAHTWTISQVSLVMELKKHEPLAGKEFVVRLIPVDDEFRQAQPNYKGKDRYVVTQINSPAQGGISPQDVTAAGQEQPHSSGAALVA